MKRLAKTTSLGWVRTSERLVKALQKFCRDTGKENPSEFVRQTLANKIGYNFTEEYNKTNTVERILLEIKAEQIQNVKV